MKQAESIPEYVDTTTPPTKWYCYHLLIGLASLIMAWLASLILEFELAKIQHPKVGFIDSPFQLDLTLSSLILVLAAINIAVLIFVFLRHLWLRKWMLVTTLTGWMALAVLALVLRSRFLPILIPSYRDQSAPVAQWIEQLRSKETVGGSTPSGGAK